MTAEPTDTPELQPEDRALADRLEAGRPLPSAGFRGALGRHLATRDPGYGPRPEHLRTLVAGWLAGGVLLLAAGALQAIGAL